MATQGIISIVKNNEVIFKCIAGCNGMTANKTAKELKKIENPTLDEVYNICKSNDFGCECLIVQTKDSFKGAEEDEELPELFKLKFNEPSFNPRWECGLASYVEIIEK